MKKGEILSTVGTTIMENRMKFLKKLKMKPPHDLAIPLLGIYVKEIKTVSWGDTCNPSIIIALFTIPKNGINLSNCQWMNAYIYILP